MTAPDETRPDGTMLWGGPMRRLETKVHALETNLINANLTNHALESRIAELERCCSVLAERCDTITARFERYVETQRIRSRPIGAKP